MQRDDWGKWAMGIALVLVIIAGVFMVVSLNKRKVPVSIGDGVVYARLANTDNTRRQGLSGTSPLGEREAMLFIFDTPGRWGMWMREMNYNIDIVWLDSAKRVIYTAKDVAPSTYPKVFLPDKDALYVVELPSGYVDEHNVGLGQVVGFAVD